MGYHENQRTSQYGLPIKPKLSIYKWMAISHVCQRWREVILGTPKLWSYIYLGPPDRVEVFLERSSQHPIHVVPFEPHEDTSASTGTVWGYSTMYPHRPSINAASLRLVLAQAHRIESLSLRQPAKVLQRAFSLLGENELHAPILKTLEFFSSEPEQASKESIPDIFSRCSFPALAHVRIHGYSSVQWHLPFLHVNLTTLSIHHEPGLFGNETFSLQALLTSLSHMPGLESLDIQSDRNKGFRDVNDHSPSFDSLISVELPCLRRLGLQRFNLLFFEKFLKHCHFPPSAKIEFGVNIQKNDKPTQLSRLGLLTPFISTGIDTDVTNAPTLGLSIYLDASLLLVAIDPTFQCILVFEASRVYTDYTSPYFTLQLACNNVDDAIAYLPKLLIESPLYNLSSLDFGCDMYEVKHNQYLGFLLSDAISRCRPGGFHTLRLSQQFIIILVFLMKALPNLISKNQPETSSTNTVNGLFGTLRTLVITDMVRTRRRTMDPIFAGYTALSVVCLVIRRELRRHKGICIPFSTLVLECIPFDGGWTDFIDAISGLIGQEGRFTQDPIAIPVDEDQDVPLWCSLPDIDLEHHRDFIELVDDWVDPVKSLYKSSRVTFDFKGNRGVVIERNIARSRQRMRIHVP